jgi:hypothetical protein
MPRLQTNYCRNCASLVPAYKTTRLPRQAHPSVSTPSRPNITPVFRCNPKLGSIMRDIILNPMSHKKPLVVPLSCEYVPTANPYQSPGRVNGSAALSERPRSPLVTPWAVVWIFVCALNGTIYGWEIGSWIFLAPDIPFYAPVVEFLRDYLGSHGFATIVMMIGATFGIVTYIGGRAIRRRLPTMHVGYGRRCHRMICCITTNPLVSAVTARRAVIGARIVESV